MSPLSYLLVDFFLIYFQCPLCLIFLTFVLGAKSNWCLTCELEILVSRAKQGESVLSPAGIMSQVHNIGAHLGPGREEDAHEFLRYLYDRVETLEMIIYVLRFSL